LHARSQTTPTAGGFNHVLVVGVFDLFHRGHVELLRRARELGDRLTVAINGDDLVEEYKRRRPFMAESDRLAIVAACRYVDHAYIARDYDTKPAIEAYRIDAIVHGDDWPHDRYLQQIRVTEAYLASRGVTIVYVPYTAGISTTDVVARIRAAEGRPGNL